MTSGSPVRDLADAEVALDCASQLAHQRHRRRQSHVHHRWLASKRRTDASTTYGKLASPARTRSARRCRRTVPLPARPGPRTACPPATRAPLRGSSAMGWATAGRKILDRCGSQGRARPGRDDVSHLSKMDVEVNPDITRPSSVSYSAARSRASAPGGRGSAAAPPGWPAAPRWARTLRGGPPVARLRLRLFPVGGLPSRARSYRLGRSHELHRLPCLGGREGALEDRRRYNRCRTGANGVGGAIGAADATGVGGSSASSTSLSPADAGDASIESGVGSRQATSRRLPIELSSLSSSRSLRSSSASVPVTSPACGVASGAAPPGVLVRWEGVGHRSRGSGLRPSYSGGSGAYTRLGPHVAAFDAVEAAEDRHARPADEVGRADQPPGSAQPARRPRWGCVPRALPRSSSACAFAAAVPECPRRSLPRGPSACPRAP